MKKLIFVLCAVLLLTTAACSAPTQPQNTTAPAQSETTQPTTQPPVTLPPVTDPSPTEPPQPHEKFDLVASKPLRGTWSATITLDADLLNLERFKGETTFQLYYSFDKHGQFSAYVDMNEFTTAVETYEQLVIQHMVDLRYNQYKTTMSWKGYSLATINEMWANGPEVENRTDCEETVATLNLYYRFIKLVRQGQYYVENDVLFTQLSETSFESSDCLVNATELKLENTTNPGIYRSLCIDFPLVFTKCE